MFTIRQFVPSTICLIAFLACGGNDCFAQRIVLKSSIQKKPGVISLGDLAVVETNDPAKRRLLERLPLFPFTGKQQTISRKEIGSVLSSSGVDLVYWRLQGSGSVTVKPLLRRVAHRTQITAASSLNDLSSHSIRQDSGQRFASNADYKEVETKSQRKWSADGRPSWARPARFYPAGRPRSPTEQKVFSPAGYSKEKKKIKVWGASRPIPRGKRITPDMLEVLEVSASGRYYVEDAMELLGKEAKHSLQPGRPIRSNSVQKPVLIQRQETVKLVSIFGGWQVSRSVVAMENGSKGDIIKLQTRDRKKRFFGKVIEPGVALVIDSSGK